MNPRHSETAFETVIKAHLLQNGALATLRHGFKCYGRTLHAAYFKAAHELSGLRGGAFQEYARWLGMDLP